MKVREDVVVALQQGVPQRRIMRTLHVSYATIVATRAALRMPDPARSTSPLRPIETEFYARTEPVGGGHLRWTSYYANGVPKLGRQGVILSAYRVAFGLIHTREPVGQVRPGCGHPRCVEPTHLDDQTMRVQLRQQLAGIFGGAL